MAENWGMKISKPNVDVKQTLTQTNKKDFVIISTDTSLRIEEATWGKLYDFIDVYIVKFLTERTVPMSFMFQPNDKNNPTEWTVK